MMNEQQSHVNGRGETCLVVRLELVLVLGLPIEHVLIDLGSQLSIVVHLLKHFQSIVNVGDFLLYYLEKACKKGVSSQVR